MRRQRRIAYRFHLRRLERRSRDELDERALFTHDEAVPLFACTACELVARWQLPDAASLRRVYAEDSYPEDRLVEMLAAQVALYRRKVPVLRRLIGRPRRILELGSFVGGFLDVAQTAGWDAIGVDPGRQLAAWCRERGRRVYAGTLEEFAAQHAVPAVDCLAIWNTFEQLPDPRPTLALAARFLGRGGLLAIRVPHGACFRALLARREAASPLTRGFWTQCLAWNNLLSFPHLYGYGLPSLDRLVTPFGFERIAAQGDVLVTLAGRATAAWARAEEQAIKRAQLAWIRGGSVAGTLVAAPWLDVYWRRV
jgi:SAM-dependent methyltransferase